jgi:hypothetical protein
MSEISYKLFEEFHICIKANMIMRSAIWAIKREETVA